MSEAVICGVRVGAAHAGVAEMVVTLRHANGACSDVTLDEAASAALFQVCNAMRAEDLEGQGWERVRHALCVASNRFAPALTERIDTRTEKSEEETDV
jgi:hypothetical protein